ncbi:PP2C family protein-serine/threonine phosphatase [Jatrophihabitans sp.]|uniref:PP2C family protein-serine/threonine phosphatase n=1 Tax=Jatrophihabitans sp. TaxID=1932789 RepID=UPI002CEF88CC|nr:protein phosphatase 2C domain-containing protein [Jatrophihabitans sp.]
MALTLKYAVRSDRGLVRGNNEDSVYAGPRLLAIADGMGGHAAGEVASKIVIGTLESLDEDRPIADLIGALRDTVADATAALAHAVAENPALEGMGTTLTAIRFAGSRIALVHVGDSRAYLLRGGQLSQITHDDTYVQSLVDSGKLTADEASHHPRKSVILRALNGTEVDPDISIREARKGDRYLLCSDGLSDVVTATTLLETLAEGTPQGCADRLVELALRGGGPDNITCIVADVVDVARGDDVPIVGGAVTDRASATDSGSNSPAARAARISEPEVVEPPVPSGHRGSRRWLVAGLVALLVVGAAVGGYLWTQRQYFVGRDGDEVAVFRGVNAHFGPVSLYSVIENSDLKIADLTQSAGGQVLNGITANSRADADAILARLADELKPPCPAATSTTPAPTPTPTPTVSRSVTASAGRTPVRTPTRPATRAPSRAATKTPATPTPSPSTATPLPSPSNTPVPGVDCR